MLRQVYLENFVRFKDKQQLQFKNGVHFFVGANNSGKSSFFEGIRRCLSTAKSTILSSSCDNKKASIVLCIFATKQTEGPDPEKILSAIIGLPNEKNGDKIYVKLAFKNERTYGVDIVKMMKTIVNREVKAEDIGSDCTNILEEILKQDNQDNGELNLQTKTTELIQKVKVIIRGNNSDTDNGFEENKDTECNKILKDLDECIVNTFPNRGIGPLQWSHSDLVDHSKREHNYKTSSEKAEIIAWYIKNKDELKEIENKNEETYYDVITDKCGLDFVISGDILKCRRRDGVDIPLLKVPEGLIEAKQCSILCAVKRFSTVVLEDPEKGMHPQMIERMRDMVFNKMTEKVILVSSHHPSFINYKTIDNVFLLRPSETGDYSNIICVGQKMKEFQRNEDKNRLTNTDFKSILYAEKVLFLEGESDLWVMESLKAYLLEINNTDMTRLLDNEHSSCDVEKLRSSLSILAMMPVRSVTTIKPYLDICSKLDIKAASLRDKDEKEIRTQNNNFVWDVGDLEDVFIGFTNWHDVRSDRDPSLLVEPYLKKVLDFGEEDSVVKTKKKGKKIGKKGSRKDIDNIVKIVTDISKEECVKQLDMKMHGRQIRNVVNFMYNFCTKMEN